MKKMIIHDNFPLVSRVSPSQAAVARAHGIPLFKGVLFEEVQDDFGRDVLRKVSDNTVVMGGAILALEHLCNAEATFKPATLNEILDINASIAGSNPDSFITCFGVGIGGSELDFGNVKVPDVKQRNIIDLIPLRSAANITGPDAAKYFMKKQNADGTTYSWYLKEFEKPQPTIKSLWKDAAEPDTDGTEILGEIYDSTRTEGIECFAEFEIKLSVNDVREHFESIGELDMARYNSLGLFTGQKVDVGDGTYDYVNVRLFSVTNFENRSVAVKTESLFYYRVYSLV